MFVCVCVYMCIYVYVFAFASVCVCVLSGPSLARGCLIGLFALPASFGAVADEVGPQHEQSCFLSFSLRGLSGLTVIYRGSGSGSDTASKAVSTHIKRGWNQISLLLKPHSHGEGAVMGNLGENKPRHPSLCSSLHRCSR